MPHADVAVDLVRAPTSSELNSVRIGRAGRRMPEMSEIRTVPMLDDAIAHGSRLDSGPLRVAATWLWTRFDAAANAELLEILATGGLSPLNAGNLKQVDRALRTASTIMFEELLAWSVKHAADVTICGAVRSSSGCAGAGNRLSTPRPVEAE